MDIQGYSAHIVVLIVAVAAYFVFAQPAEESYPYTPQYELTSQPLHWHPWLKIMIDGEERYIPDNIGVTKGKVIDTPLGMDQGVSPTHTHEGTDEYGRERGRKVHLENLDPKRKPETLTLGYFFKVWEKNFNSTCIMEKCNGPEGKLKMTVNGKENFDYGHYFLRDGDEILITFE